jgi:hypothetical protein
MVGRISRRQLIGSALLASALELVRTRADAAAATPLDVNDATARSLGFVPDAAKVDISSNPTFKIGQHCAVCAQYQGKATEERAACNIYPGRSVPAGGWCRVWTQRI